MDVYILYSSSKQCINNLGFIYRNDSNILHGSTACVMLDTASVCIQSVKDLKLLHRCKHLHDVLSVPRYRYSLQTNHLISLTVKGRFKFIYYVDFV